jgi:sulfate permease, SulP family
VPTAIMSSQVPKTRQPQHWFSSLIAGLVLGVIGVLTYITPMAALVFSGKLAPFLATGIGITLFSAAAVGFVVALQSSFVGAIALPVPEEMAILGAIAAAIAAQLPDSAPTTELLLTVVGAITLTSLLTGGFLFFLGQLNLGELIRFLPYPVVGGFLAGLGCLLSQGAFKVMTERDLGLAQLAAFFQADLLVRWLPGFLLAIGLLAVSRRYTHFLIMPMSFLAATGLFYLIWVLTGHPIADASTQGWLLGPFPQGQLWQPLSFAALGQANWAIVFSQLSSMISVMLITALSLLMVSSGIELTTRRDVNLNQELRATGMGCLVSGVFGGMVGSHGVTTVLVHKMGVRSRWVGVFAALFYLVILLAGLSLISFFPKPVLGGLLLFLGLDLLVQWLYESWFKLPRLDYAIVVLIMAIIAAIGLVEGVTIGLITAIILFAVQYSQVDVAKHVLSGANLSSHVQRPLPQARLLRQQGDRSYILQLQGFIFFGTANTLLNRIRQRLQSAELSPPQFIILDFRSVHGLDSSAILSFVKLNQLVETAQIYLVFANLPPEMQQRLSQGGVPVDDENSFCRLFATLDAAMEWCEEEILKDSHYRRRRSVPMALQLQLLLADFLDGKQSARMMEYLEEISRSPGETLCSPGEPPTYLYFIESGEVSRWVSSGTAAAQRQQTLGAGTIVGEIEFFTRQPYSVTIISDQSSKLFRLSHDNLQKMYQHHPQLAEGFGQFMNALLAERLAQSQQEIALLMR